MANLPISVLPNVLASGVTPTDLLVIVNYDVFSGTTKNITTFDLQTYVTSGITDDIITGGTYSGGTLVLNTPGGPINISGFTTGTTLYEVGTGVDSTQRKYVGAEASGDYSVISGGKDNTAIGDYSAVSSGSGNTANNDYSFIGGGQYNTNEGKFSFIGGGQYNTDLSSGSAYSGWNTLSGGYCNTHTGTDCYSSVIGGGSKNTTSGNYVTIGGGCINKVISNSGTISGGDNNRIGNLNGIFSVKVVAPYGPTILGIYGPYGQSYTDGSGFGATFNFEIYGSGSSVITINNPGENYQVGDYINFSGSTFPGGVDGVNDVVVQVLSIIPNSGYASAIGGGYRNTAFNCYSSISGGYANRTFNSYSTIGGGVGNTTNSSYYGGDTIGGGSTNTTNSCFLSNSTIAGGSRNTTYSAYYDHATIGGGYRNKTLDDYGTIGGGGENRIGRLNAIGKTTVFSYTGTIGLGQYGPYSQSYTTGLGNYATFIFDVSTPGTIDVSVEYSGENYQIGDYINFSGSTFPGGVNGVDDVIIVVDTIARNSGCGSTISGGYGNEALSCFSTIGGGEKNFLNSPYSTISGGYGNSNAPIAIGSTIGGGVGNCVGRCFATISGGYENTSSGLLSSIGGGSGNKVLSENGTITGGEKNIIGRRNLIINWLKLPYGGSLQGIYQPISPTATSGSGSGAKFRFDFDGLGNYSVFGLNLGQNYNVNDLLYFSGSTFSPFGVNGDDDLILQITEVRDSGSLSSINGGGNNTIVYNTSTISGGYGNTSSSYVSTIGGGFENTILGPYDKGGYQTISGGYKNTIGIDPIKYTDNSFIGGGEKNTILGGNSLIGGGCKNVTTVNRSTISGGVCNTIGINGTISGYYGLTYTGTIMAGTYGPYSPTSIGTGLGTGANFLFNFDGLGGVTATTENVGYNYIDSDNLTFSGYIFGGTPITDDVTFKINTSDGGGNSFIGGGASNIINSFGVINGGCSNTIDVLTVSNCYGSCLYPSTIGGGSLNTISSYVGNIVSYGNTIAGGSVNITESSYLNGQTISGGYFNKTGNDYATIGGGSKNCNYGKLSTIGGGVENVINKISENSTIGGGGRNSICGNDSVISGGKCNTANCDKAFIGGGATNTVFGCYSSIVGGNKNFICSQYSGILGGSGNTINNDCSFIVGYGITTSCPNTTYVNCLNIFNLPTEASLPLPPGTIYRCTTGTGTQIHVVP